MITTRAVPALLPAHHRRVAVSPATIRNDFADPLLRAGIGKGLHFYLLALLPEATKISTKYYSTSGTSLEWIELDAIDRAPFARPGIAERLKEAISDDALDLLVDKY